MESSDYLPPGQGDYDNVVELNRAWLSATSELSRTEQEQLANAPFLLFSLREQGLDWWDRALAEQSDLLRDAGGLSDALRRVQSAALAFLWHLADRNPYAARIISGASVAWCDMLTSVPLVTLIHRVGDRGDLLVSRIEARQKSADSTHMIALHGLLTQSRIETYSSLGSAACEMPAARMRVADRRGHKKV